MHIHQTTKTKYRSIGISTRCNKYVNAKNFCKPIEQQQSTIQLIVLMLNQVYGELDKTASNCDSAKHPFCGPNDVY